MISVVSIAQLVEHQVVVLGVVGSSPTTHPILMEFKMSAMFWGLLFVAFGITLILETILKIDIPFFKIIFALALIYWGLSILLGTSIKTQIDSTCEYIKVVFEEKP